MPEKTQITIRRALGFVTNVDAVDLVSNYFKRVRGLRNNGDSYLCQRDYGTKHRYASYPTGISIQCQFTFIDPSTGTEYDVVGGLDASNNLRFFVWDTDPVDATAKWNEITKKLACVITGGVSGAPTIGTITDILGAAYTLATDELTGWIAYNPTRGNAALIASNTSSAFTTIGTLTGSAAVNVSDATNASPIVVTTTTHNYSDGDFVIIAGVEGNTAANGVWQIYDKTVTTFKLLASIGNGAYTTGGTSQKGLGWISGDAISLFRLPAAAWHYTYGNGALPHIRFGDIEQQKKLNIFYGSAASATSEPTMREPIQVQRKNDTQNYFYDSAGAPLLVFDFADEFKWFADRKQLSPVYESTGSASTNSAAIGEFTLEDGSGNDMLLLRYEWTRIATSAAVAAQAKGLRIKITLTYDGYQETDPVHAIFMSGESTSYPDIRFKTLLVNAARMNRRITHINIYGAYTSAAVYDAGWADADSDYYLLYSIPLLGIDGYYNPDLGDDAVFPDTTTISALVQAQYWRAVTTVEYTHAMWSDSAYLRIDYSIVMYGVLLGITLASSLNHVSDTTRTALTPRFMAKVTRAQGSLVVTDQNDSTLRLSSYNGDLVNEDDNFPLRSTDLSGNSLRIVLTSTDALKGLAVNRAVVCAFKTREVETYDLYSNVQDILPCDFLARRSLVATPFGLFWAGSSGIYWMPKDGGPITLINGVWQNFYDGTLLIPDGSKPYITSAYRAAIIAGYNPYYREIWFHCQVTTDAGSTEYLCFRFSPETWYREPARAWMVRELNIGSSAAATDFGSRRSDGTFVIAYASGLLKYPYISKDDGTETQYRHQDDVTSADATASKGVPMDFTLCVGEISSQLVENVIRELIPEFVSDVLASTWPLLTIELYANGDTVAFDTQTWPLADDKVDLAKIEEFGKITRLEIKCSLSASTDERDAKKVDISGITLVADKAPRGGNV